METVKFIEDLPSPKISNNSGDTLITNEMFCLGPKLNESVPFDALFPNKNAIPLFVVREILYDLAYDGFVAVTVLGCGYNDDPR
jgi:hypothetical protein